MPQFSDRGGSAPDRRNLLGAAGGYGLSFSLSPSPFGLPPPLAPFWVLPLPPLDFGLRNGQHTAENGIKRRLGLEHRRIPRCPWGLQGVGGVLICLLFAFLVIAVPVVLRWAARHEFASRWHVMVAPSGFVHDLLIRPASEGVPVTHPAIDRQEVSLTTP